jgi:hypothetical protein
MNDETKARELMEIIKDYYNLKNNKTKHNKLVK